MVVVSVVDIVVVVVNPDDLEGLRRKVHTEKPFFSFCNTINTTAVVIVIIGPYSAGKLKKLLTTLKKTLMVMVSII